MDYILHDIKQNSSFILKFIDKFHEMSCSQSEVFFQYEDYDAKVDYERIHKLIPDCEDKEILVKKMQLLNEFVPYNLI